MMRYKALKQMVTLFLLRGWLKLRSERGAETVEYLGLGVIVVLLGAAVWAYVSGGIGAITSQIGRIMSDIISGMAQGW